ncbi:MAG TPA: hypothetical protein VN843_36560 [Anaerolineales bacterium]|nr:hypothetical protein [Anaerolineales bacterium]
MKRPLSIVLSLTIATAIVCLVPGRAKAQTSQTVEMKPCTTRYDSYYAIAGGPHIPEMIEGTTPINWLLFAALLGYETETDCP